MIPITSTYRNIPSHVRIEPPEGGLKNVSFALCEAVRSVSHVRLARRLGMVSRATLAEVERTLRVLMEL